jgi:hypothetical protein
MGAKLLMEAGGLALALLTTWLQSKGVKVSPQELAKKADKYLLLNQKDLTTEEGRDDDRWG